jgi:siroheme synthase
LPAAVKQEGLESPAIIVLGEVVRLARQESLSELVAVAA